MQTRPPPVASLIANENSSVPWSNRMSRVPVSRAPPEDIPNPSFVFKIVECDEISPGINRLHNDINHLNFFRNGICWWFEIFFWSN